MDEETGTQGGEAESNELIRSLRAQIKEAKTVAKDAVEDARVKVARESTAKSLMPSGFEGLANYFEQEVDGELTAEAAAEWLKERGIAVSPDDVVEKDATIASDVEGITNLGSAVAAAASENPDSDFDKRLGETAEGLKGAGDLPELNRKLEALFAE